ncbi:MAG TPA: hypothetical protein VMX94_07000 [Armatimonadota bacterium]|nr:hypothetical protein [Armatimonadota bacterium]
MNMVRHDDEFVYPNTRVVIRHLLPNRQYHLPNLVQAHVPVYDLAKQTLSAMGAECHKVSPFLRVIVPWQPNGAPMVLLRIECHRMFTCRGNRPWLPNIRAGTGACPYIVSFVNEKPVRVNAPSAFYLEPACFVMC